ncbi:fimbria/pilus periplasmic chaperone [Parasphingorhabdus sp.]|uniref:fimbrial biogenesis chaperone n=1 Tax=Parasphingorhabdus sp. TaxID=2709688 RepID=UPI003264395C
MSNFLKLVALFVTAAMLVALTPAFSYDMKPIVIQLAPTGAGATQSVVLTNTHDVPIAIEVRAYTRAQNPDGTENRAPEDDDLIITPPQMVIAPKASQSFKVRWIGEPAPDKEIAFRLVSSQLPIKFRDEKKDDVSVNVSMNYRYEAALYVVPPQSKPSARLTAIAPVKDENGETWLELKVLSDGTRRAILDNPILVVSPKNGGTPVTLEGEQMANLTNLNILVGNERVVRLPWPDGLAPGPVDGELRTAYTVFN